MASDLIRIYPLPGVSIPGVPANEQEVTAAVWARYQKFQPPAFTTHPPPRAVTVQQPEGPTEKVGSSDSGGSV